MDPLVVSLQGQMEVISQEPPVAHSRSVLRAVVQSKAPGFAEVYTVKTLVKRLVQWLQDPENDAVLGYLLEHCCGGRFESKSSLVRFVETEEEARHDQASRDFLVLYVIPLCFKTRLLVFGLRNGDADMRCSDGLLYKSTLECPALKLKFFVNNESKNTTVLLQYAVDKSNPTQVVPIPAEYDGSGVYTMLLYETAGMWTLYNKVSAIGCVGGSRAANKEADTTVTYTFTDEERKAFRRFKSQFASMYKWKARKARRQVHLAGSPGSAGKASASGHGQVEGGVDEKETTEGKK